MSNDPNTLQQIASDPQNSVWVDASAGTGKTKVLTDRVLRLLLKGIRPEKILCITYTNAAAAEMDIRITRRLRKWITLSDEELTQDLKNLIGKDPSKNTVKDSRILFTKILDDIDGLKIMTIHSYCQSLLKRFPIEAGLSPNFSLIDDLERQEIFDEAFKNTVTASQNDKNLKTAINILAKNTSDSGIKDVVKMIVGSKHRFSNVFDNYKSSDILIEKIYKHYKISQSDNEEKIIENSGESINHIGLKSLSETLIQYGNENDKKRGLIILGFLQNENTFSNYKKVFLTQDNSHKPKQTKSIITKKALETLPEAEEIIYEEQSRLMELEEKLKSYRTIINTQSIIYFSNALITFYENYKNRSSLLDYDDLIEKTIFLLENTDVSPWIMFKLDGGIDFLLLDEAQDTSPEQWKIINYVTEEFFSGLGASKIDRRTFFVGDKKQSIYSFQGAKPDRFDSYRGIYEDNSKKALHNWSNINLNTSFRSTEPILKAVDKVFSNPQLKNSIDRQDSDITHLVSRQNEPGSVEVWELQTEKQNINDSEQWPLPRKTEKKNHSKDLLAQKISSVVKKWINEKRLIATNESLAPIKPEDIIVLVRRRDTFVEKIVKEFKKQGVPVAGIDRMRLEDHIAILDLICIGHFTQLPNDDLNLATLLKSPIINISEEDLYKIASDRKASMWEKIKKDKENEITKMLSTLIEKSKNLTPYDFFTHLLDVVGFRKKIIEKLGVEANDPINEFLNICFSYQQKHNQSLQSFINWFKTREIEIKRNLEQKSGVVRVMTVHAAKGLQAPIVFLCDTTSTPTKRYGKLCWVDDYFLWPGKKENLNSACKDYIESEHDDEYSEYLRLLYVAMTRAANELYVCGTAKEDKQVPKNCWYSIIKDALEHISKNNENGISIKKESSLNVVKENKDLKDNTPPLPPIFKKISKSEKTDLINPSQKKVVSSKNKRVIQGIAIHKMLEALPNIPSDKWKEYFDTLRSRSFQLSEADFREAANEAIKVLNNKDLDFIFKNNSFAEVDISRNEDDKNVIVGRIDRLVIQENQVLIIDYKTESSKKSNHYEMKTEYIEQMEQYREVVSSIYKDKNIKCYLFWTKEMKLQELQGPLD